MCQLANVPMSECSRIDAETKDVELGGNHLNTHYMRNYKSNPIVDKTFRFAVLVVEFADVLIEKKRFAIADQLLRSGCSIGANVREAQGAESKADFIHKMKVAYKEAEETEYWLELCNSARSYPKPEILLSKIEEILKILNSIISTSKGGRL
jgi:four helix bundle protein